MDYLTDKGFSTRLSCRVVGLSRSSYQRARRQRAKRSGNPSADRYHLLREWMNEFADTHRRWGYRRGLVHARGAGFSVSRDVFRRLWREENLRVFPRKQRKQVISHNPEPRKGAAEKPGEIWALDFQFDSDYTGRAFKICNVIDEFSRKHVTFSLARSISAADVVEMLDVAVLEHGCPKVLRMDNGPEFIAGKLRDWVDEQQLTQAFIPPGQPWHNGFVESFHNRMRDELLADNVFDDHTHAARMVAWWSQRYNQLHPHSFLGYLSPDAFVECWKKENLEVTS